MPPTVRLFAHFCCAFHARHLAVTAIGTSLATLDWDTVVDEDPGFSYAAGELTIGALLDGKRAMMAAQVNCDTNGNNRVELRIELDHWDGSSWTRISKGGAYATRNNTQDQGAAVIVPFPVRLVEGHKYRLRVVRVGATANTDPDGCHFTVWTI